MATLSPDRVRELLNPYADDLSPLLLDRLTIYLDLLLRWNARTNLSAIREPEEIVQRHFGESLFASRYVGEAKTLLDIGSGAGFPGLPIALARPELAVTLAESQNKKAAFLREVIRTLEVKVAVWGGRVEEMPKSLRFDVVTLRAVDRPAHALELAASRVAEQGVILHLTSGLELGPSVSAVPGLRGSVLHRLVSGVPRGTAEDEA